jgi:hypothetical protein
VSCVIEERKKLLFKTVRPTVRTLKGQCQKNRNDYFAYYQTEKISAGKEKCCLHRMV